MIFTNNYFWYKIKISIHTDESNIYQYENNSSKFAPWYPITLNNTPFIIYHKKRYIIKVGFLDCHLEINALLTESDKKEKEEYISQTIFTPYCCQLKF